MKLPLPILSNRLYWLVRLRWIACAGVFAVVWLTSEVLDVVSNPVELYIIASGMLGYNCIFAILIRKRVPIGIHLDRNIILQMSLDQVALILLLYFSGFPYNPFIFYFVFHMTIAAMLQQQLYDDGQHTQSNSVEEDTTADWDFAVMVQRQLNDEGLQHTQSNRVGPSQSNKEEEEDDLELVQAIRESEETARVIQQAQIVSWNQFLENFGRGLGPLLSGIFLTMTLYNYQLTVFMISGCVIPGIVLWFFALRWYKGDMDNINIILAERAEILKDRQNKS